METGIFEQLPRATKFEALSKEVLIDRLIFVEDECARIIKELYQIRNQDLTDSQAILLLEEQLEAARGKLYGTSSERHKKPEPKDQEFAKEPEPRVRKPSERYPNVPVREVVIGMDPVPDCSCCGAQMSDSGMTENSEALNVIPKKYEIVLTKRVKYRCSCQNSIVTAPAPARIIEGSSFTDEMILDVALSKYCDLLPMHRYVSMAGRGGVKGLAGHSLIELTHGLSDFLYPVYMLLKESILKARVVHADETPHRMLEGSEKKSWFLWGFSTKDASYFECHDTRSGDIASDFLNRADCEFLVSDVYSGYGKAIRITNEYRLSQKKKIIQNANCNAHARRYFFKALQSKYSEASFYLDQYHEIYKLNGSTHEKPPPIIQEYRDKMRSLFEAMKSKAIEEIVSYPAKGQYGKALGYFLENFEGLTLFLKDPEVPIDNNPQERLLRSPVVGRKTWYGTHSQRGSKTAAILFSLVESCKLIGVNPREYFTRLTTDMLAGKKPYTPHDFKLTL